MSLSTLISGCEADQANSPTSEPIIGVWVTNVDSDILFSDVAIADGMERIAEMGFNTVYPVVWNDSYTLYPSDVMAETFGEPFRQDSAFSNQNRDPLAVVIQEARKHNLRVIPWFEFGFSSSHSKNGGHIIEAKPEWAAKDSSGQLLTKNGFEWMNAIHPDVQDFVTSMILEVARNYDIDGIQGDDRLPAMPSEGGYSDFTRQLYSDETGNQVPANPSEENFLNWKANKLSDFAEKLYSDVKEVNPDLTVSFSPSIYPWSKEEYLQDWPEWIRRGAVDELIPQVYRWDIESYKATLDETLQFYEEAGGPSGVQFASGIIIKAGDRYNGFDYVKEAVDYNRSNGVDGEVYFFYEGLFENNGHLGDSLKTHYYSP
jgi:uncharacterized lipoprotein YddW (UPF0748 family)